MTRKIFAIVMLTALFLNSCKETSKQEESSNETQKTERVSEKEVFGTYEGTSPGANSLIKTTLTINSDNTFVRTLVYVDKGDEEFTEKGTFKIEDKKVVLNVNHDESAGYYKVFDNYLLQLDANGKEIENDFAAMYKMSKVKM